MARAAYGLDLLVMALFGQDSLGLPMSDSWPNDLTTVLQQCILYGFALEVNWTSAENDIVAYKTGFQNITLAVCNQIFKRLLTQYHQIPELNSNTGLRTSKPC